MAIGTSEKLVQEGLRRNRDRLAVGKRVGSCVRKVAHDLESMRGAGGLRRLYQTDRWVRMVNTKLTNGSVWYRERSLVGSRVSRDRMVGQSSSTRRPPRRPVRTHHTSNRRNDPAFQNHGRSMCPSFFFRTQQKKDSR